MNIRKFLEKNVKPATGCTEPIAVGYAVSLAYHAIFGDVPQEFAKDCPSPEIDRTLEISVQTDRDVFKNAAAIMIPGTEGKKGLAIAAAMGLYCDPAQELNLFHGAGAQVRANANRLLSSGKVRIEPVEDAAAESELDIKVRLQYMNGGAPKTAFVNLQHSHSNIATIQVDGQTLYTGNGTTQSSEESEILGSLAELIDIAKNLTSEERDLIHEGIEMNRQMVEEGLRGEYALRSGRQIQNFIEQGIYGKDVVTAVKMNAAAAGDARMGGADMPVMSTAGSGNQGITALVPLLTVGERGKYSRERIAEAAMLTHLVTKYVSNHSGYLSALCGCTIKAGVGAAAGVTYLLGGDHEQINNAINIMIGNITGIICDGAKEGCALKLSTAAGVATESAYSAIAGLRVPADNGIVYDRAEDSMRGIGKISKAMVSTDMAIVDIMQAK
jgi:L-cysteine desulfidase